MISRKLLTRTDFRESVFKRDQYKCVICGKDAESVHHIMDRSLFTCKHDLGGYFIDNGVSLCYNCHLDAEKCILSCEFLRYNAWIDDVILPEGYNPKKIYNKWGIEIHKTIF